MAKDKKDTARMKGIVIGKFYPFHKGHEYLVSQALAQVDYLTIIVCEHKSQSISGALRAEWIKETFPQAEVIVVEDILDADNSKGWAEYTLKTLGYAPDFVFTSESYGEKYASFLGSKHVLVDQARAIVPISATKIRKNALVNWKYLSPCVRAYYAKRVCVVGAESTGTTTMAKALAEYYKTVWVPEFGRTYAESKWAEEMKWESREFVHIAQQQDYLEDKLAKECNKILICDTNSFATSVWHERYMGFASKEVEEVAKNRKYDLYLLTDTDIPFVQDGFRDGEHIRTQMHQRFLNKLNENNVPYVILSGNHESRMQKAIQACDDLLK